MLEMFMTNYLLLSLAAMLSMTTMCSAASIREVGGTKDGYFTSNRQLQFDCEYDSSSFTFLYFMHNGTRIYSGGRYFIQNSDTHYSLIVSSTVPTDGGSWSCKIRSVQNRGTITRSTMVMYEEPVRLIPEESSVVGAYQQPYTVTCTGENIRTWEWVRNGVTLSNSSNGRVQLLSNGRLHFTTLRYEDAGVYYCRGINNFDDNQYATYRLTVNALPVVSVVKRPSSVIKVNDALNITCMASGVGLQSVTWSKESDGAQLDDNSSHRLITVFKNATTIISELRFSAVTGSQQDTYRCNATSTAGSSYDLTEVSLSGLPGAPPPPSLSVINVTMVMVRWQTPNDTGNLDLSHFQINYGKVGGKAIHHEVLAPQMEHVFSLLLATRYYFSVAAMNEHGRGPFSQQSTITTHSTTPNALMIMVANVTANAVLLSWQPLTGNDTGGSPITGYIITYYYTSASIETNKSIDISEVSGDSYWLTGLMDNKLYHVMMCAVNINGSGEESSLVNFTTPLGSPDPVSELKAVRVDDKIVTISWTGDVADQQLLYYRITITSQDTVVLSYNLTISMISTKGMVHSFDVTELEPYKCYKIAVTAVNEKGHSISQYYNISCDPKTGSLTGNITISVHDGQLRSGVIITIAIPAVVLLILVILVVAVSIILCRRCRRSKQHDMETRNNYNSKKRDSESSTAPLNYHRNDSIDTQDSISSQLSVPHTVDSFVSENLPFKMSNNGPLDPIQESPVFDERPRQPTPDNGVVWTVGPAEATNSTGVIFEYEDEPRSPMIQDPTEPFIDDEPVVYTDNAAYYSVSHEANTQLATNYSGVRILSDSRNDGKEVVILPDNR